MNPKDGPLARLAIACTPALIWASACGPAPKCRCPVVTCAHTQGPRRGVSVRLYTSAAASAFHSVRRAIGQNKIRAGTPMGRVQAMATPIRILRDGKEIKFIYEYRTPWQVNSLELRFRNDRLVSAYDRSHGYVVIPRLPHEQ